jgi:AcrR family transcriptional regulator
MPSTPTRRSAAERVAQIADAARAIAIESGLSAVTLRAVASEVGVAPALVAHYAPSMDDLVADTSPPSSATSSPR